MVPAGGRLEAFYYLADGLGSTNTACRVAMSQHTADVEFMGSVNSAGGLGSTMAIVDNSGSSQKSYQYDVYGEVTGGSGSLSQEFDFASQQTDGTGLQYLRARYYDPATGTFLSRDPLAAFPAWRASTYAYVGGRPTTRIDPSGLDQEVPFENWGCEMLGPLAGRVCAKGVELADEITDALDSLDDGILSVLTGLQGEYLKDFRAGCAADKGLCALYGIELLTAHLINSLMTGTAGMACAETAGLACVFTLASAGAHRRIFKVLTDETKARIVERGRFERRKNELLESQRGARCVLSGEC